MEFNNFNKELAKSEDSEKDDTGSGKSRKKKSAGSAAVLAELTPSKQRPDQKTASGTRYTETALIGSRAVGELVAGGLSEAAASPNIPKVERATVSALSLASEKQVDHQPIVRFDKKAEEFSRTELLQTAEKIKIEGVDLKEMLELGRIDESGLRRIVKEFLEGGSVSAALSKEVQEKELKFERDPRMKLLLAADGADGDGASDSHDTPESMAVQNIGLSAMNMTFQNDSQEKAGPVPDKATLRKVRNQQMATVGGTALFMVAFILVALWLTR